MSVRSTGAGRPAALAGQVVLVPRSTGQAAGLAALLRSCGAEPLLAPTIAIRPAADVGALDAALAGLAAGRFAWLAFTSRNGVEAAASRAAALDLAPGWLGGALVAVVGASTAAAVRSLLGVEPDLLPPVATAAGLAAAFPSGDGGQVLLLRGNLAGDELPQGLSARGWRPLPVVAYLTEPLDALPAPVRRRLEAGEVDWVAFTSASTVEGFGRAWRAALPARTRVAVIGPATSAAARAAGLAVAAEAVEHSADGLVSAMAASAGRHLPSTDEAAAGLPAPVASTKE